RRRLLESASSPFRGREAPAALAASVEAPRRRGNRVRQGRYTCRLSPWRTPVFKLPFPSTRGLALSSSLAIGLFLALVASGTGRAQQPAAPGAGRGGTQPGAGQDGG